MLSSVIQQSGQGPGIPGVPQLVAKFDATAQAANIAQFALYNVPTGGGGMYRVSAYIILTQAATTSSTLPQVLVDWIDVDTSVENNIGFIITNTGNTVGTVGVQNTGSVKGGTINAKAGTAIKLATAGYVSSGATPMQYAVHAKLEYLGA